MESTSDKNAALSDAKVSVSQRRKEILGYLRAKKWVARSEAHRDLKMSKSTLDRDIQVLQGKGSVFKKAVMFGSRKRPFFVHHDALNQFEEYREEGKIARPYPETKRQRLAHIVEELKMLYCRCPDVEEVAIKLKLPPTFTEVELYKYADEIDWHKPTKEERYAGQCKALKRLFLAGLKEVDPDSETLKEATKRDLEVGEFYRRKHPDLVPSVRKNPPRSRTQYSIDFSEPWKVVRLVGSDWEDLFDLMFYDDTSRGLTDADGMLYVRKLLRVYDFP